MGATLLLVGLLFLPELFKLVRQKLAKDAR